MYSEQNQLALLYQETRQCPDPLSSPDQVFTPSSSGLSSQSFDFSFTTSGRSSSEEFPSTSAPSNLSIGPDPLQGFPQDEEIHPQQHGSHQMWLTDSSKQASRPAIPEYSEHQTNLNSISALSLVPQTILPPVPPFKAPKRQNSEEFICTPPYTPRVGSGSFIFGDEPFKSDQGKRRQSMTSVSLSAGLAQTTPTQHCRKRLYETLPPTPDSPGSDECILMALPEIRGPLFVDVPHIPYHAPPEGLLTPEASPTKKPCLSFFSHEEKSEIERMEISLLAQYISTLAEGFCHNHPQAKCNPSPAPPHHASSHNPASSIEGPNSSLAHIDVSMFEEKTVDGIPLSSTSPVPLSPYSSPSALTPTPISHSSPVHTQEEVTLIGVHHLCSVHLTQCNCMATGGLREAESPEGKAFTESAMDVEMMPPMMSTTIPASPGSIPAQALSAPTPALPCAQSLLEELVSMEPVFGATAPMTPAKRQQDELYQLPHQGGQQIFYQGKIYLF